MNILDKIIAYKRTEVVERKAKTSVAELEKSAAFTRPVLSLQQSLLDDTKTGIIAEFKRKSPSKGIINDKADVVAVTSAYTRFGASGLSVLTDTESFGGSTEDVLAARVNQIPILRKEFIVDEYQIVEARAMGADAILLIAACLTPADVKRLATFAQSLQLEVLLELHDEEELEHICDETVLVGINNRNLKTFAVDIQRSLAMAARIPASKVKIAESGISSVANIRLFRDNGFRGFLIGENFMKEADPARAFEQFVQALNG
ncbi:indole-3-glycerol phosphate synthase TrpC [Paraflavitalea pollutisoli]|uniref:indole-3-glycerol phosphate synthase TrpC n=1 Tax=Paraflavitalea pollutisoli TaxID=3034143 RepID=UPI0023ED8A22|nr:indole-3-glycerol phosphate synthase TrpC [Paraflavitalea sp. H1-2-19X]